GVRCWHPWLVSSWRRLFESNRVRWAVNPAATEAKGIRLREERAISRQTIAQGRPDALRWTCMLVCALLCAIAHETAGAARTRSSLHPLTLEGASEQVQLGRVAARTHWHIRACRPDTISADNHPELSPVATVSPCGIFRRLPRGRRQ